MLNLLLVSFSLVGQTPALEIVEPRATYGHLGAVRPKGAGMLPGDIGFFTFGIKNLKLDDNGLAKYSVGIEVRDSAGKLFFEQKPFNTIAQNVFGGDTIPNSATISVPLNQPPTDLTWKITVKDRNTDKSVEHKGEGKILPADFGLVRVATFADAESRRADRAGGRRRRHDLLEFLGRRLRPRQRQEARHPVRHQSARRIRQADAAENHHRQDR